MPDHSHASAVPEHLDEAGAALYRDTVNAYYLTLAESAALLQAAETVDTLTELEAELRTRGRVTPAGKPSPLLVELRQQRAILVRLLGLLDLRDDEDDDGASATATSRAARKAARTRWDKMTKGR